MNNSICDPINYIAIKLLEEIGIHTPSQITIDKMEVALSHTVIKQSLSFAPVLSDEEAACLFWAAKGKTISETALALSTDLEKIKTLRKNIISKMEVSNITQAVFEGIRFAYLNK